MSTLIQLPEGSVCWPADALSAAVLDQPMSYDAVAPLEGVVMGVNYGLNKVRFTAPVPVGSRVRARVTLLEMEVLPPLPNAPALAGAQLTWTVTIEREGQERPVCVAESISRRYS